MIFPVFQFTVQEYTMDGKAEWIVGADFYFDWIDEGAMPVQDVRLSGVLPAEVGINQDYQGD